MALGGASRACTGKGAFMKAAARTEGAVSNAPEGDQQGRKRWLTQGTEQEAEHLKTLSCTCWGISENPHIHPSFSQEVPNVSSQA